MSSTATRCDTDTKLWLHMDGSDASTTFTDSSVSAHTITANGDAQIDTAQKKFGTGSGLFDATGTPVDYLSTAHHADWDIGSGNFTIDFWVRFNNLPTVISAFVSHGTGAPNFGFSFFIYNNAGTYQLYLQLSSDGSTVDSTKFVSLGSAPSTSTWYHVAIVRSGNNLYFFWDGTQIGSTVDVTGITIYNPNQELWIGTYNSSTFPLDGWLDELRIVKGTAVWTSNFTPPTAAYVSTNVKSDNGLAYASIKSKNGLAITSIKSWNGLA